MTRINLRWLRGALLAAGLILAARAPATAACGNGILEINESCDDGDSNGRDGCCTTNCQLVDSDRDGICDSLDGCSSPNPALVDAPRFTVGGVSTPAGDDTLRFTGLLTLESTSVDPASRGMRITVTQAFVGPILAAVILGGNGWTARAEGDAWSYHDPLGSNGGITRIVVRRKWSTTFVLRIEGRRGTYAPPYRGPLTVSLALDADPAAAACGVARFSMSRCGPSTSGRTLRCDPVPPLVPCRDSRPDPLLECEIRNVASAEEAYFVVHETYYSGSCDGLPGFDAPAGLSCTAAGTSLGFSVAAAHVAGTEVCIWDSNPAAGTPQMRCI